MELSGSQNATAERTRSQARAGERGPFGNARAQEHTTAGAMHEEEMIPTGPHTGRKPKTLSQATEVTRANRWNPAC